MTMASFFGEIIEPSTRALCEDCSDEETNDKTNLQITWKPGYTSGPANLKTFLVIDGTLTLAFAEAFLLDPSHVVVGEVNFSSDNLDSALSSPLIQQDNILACFVHPKFPANSSFDFADLVSTFARDAEEVVVLTSQPLSSYKTFPGESPLANVVFSLATSTVKSKPVRPLPEEANILTGISASVASWCEIYKIPASVYICYSDSDVLDSLTAQPLLGILPQRQDTPNLKRRWLYGGCGRPVGSQSNMYM